jgi:hypothetical protein
MSYLCNHLIILCKITSSKCQVTAKVVSIAASRAITSKTSSHFHRFSSSFAESKKVDKRNSHCFSNDFFSKDIKERDEKVQ